MAHYIKTDLILETDAPGSEVCKVMAQFNVMSFTDDSKRVTYGDVTAWIRDLSGFKDAIENLEEVEHASTS